MGAVLDEAITILQLESVHVELAGTIYCETLIVEDNVPEFYEKEIAGGVT